MATAAVKRPGPFGPASGGILMTPRDFDRAEFVEGWRYELMNGVLVVTPTLSPNERDPNQYLGSLLINYQETHSQAGALDATLPEHLVNTGANRRRADRVIWTGLGRLPRRKDVPRIIAEFVSAAKRSWPRYYEVRRDEYLAIGVKEYWVFNRFEHTLTVFFLRGGKRWKRAFRKNQHYTTDLLPGFDLPQARLFKLADRWPSGEPAE